MTANISLTVVLNESVIRQRAQKSGLTEEQCEHQVLLQLDSKARAALIWDDAVLFVLDADVLADDGASR